MLSVPFVQGTELAHNDFQTLHKILPTLKKPVQGPCTPCWHLLSGQINRACTVIGSKSNLCKCL